MLNCKKLNVGIQPDLYLHIEENAPTTKLKFINRLTVELAKARGYENVTIKGWVQNNRK